MFGAVDRASSRRIREDSVGVSSTLEDGKWLWDGCGGRGEGGLMVVRGVGVGAGGGVGREE